MLKDRIKQFRTYNNLKPEMLSEVLEISTEDYEAFENGSKVPGIDIISRLSELYRVTVDEFYGYTPRLTIRSDAPVFEDSPVEERILKMSDLSWDEAQLILYYRKKGSDDTLIKKIIEGINEE